MPKVTKRPKLKYSLFGDMNLIGRTVAEREATSLKPKTITIEPRGRLICLACSGSGVNSKGGHCYPCFIAGRVKIEIVQGELFDD